MEQIFFSITYPPIPITQIGPLAFSLHGVFAALGFYFGANHALKLAEKDGADTVLFSDALTWAIFGAIIGARFFTIPAHILEPGYGLDDVFTLAGSYSIMGGMAGGIIAAFLKISYFNKQSFKQYGDYAATGLILGTIIGRIGDLAIVEHLGRASNFILAYEIKPGYDVAPQHNGLECSPPLLTCGSFHHVALYDLLFAFLIFFLFINMKKRFNFGQGSWIGLWAFWYGIQRFILDTLRFGMGDSTIGNVTYNQIGGLLLALIGLIVFFKNKNLEQI
ncbi:MAG: prolipoprotein diacylglyceryl transferase [Actinomycetota bacterium]|nr:prolipoprotein diacylglyceryl transferase [Actinomycetota bacterium]MDA3013033.1 prolipoprotein diacylglyceryl transferase [Actinomycetota bacterium]